jgi:hypothetical protein
MQPLWLFFAHMTDEDIDWLRMFGAECEAVMAAIEMRIIEEEGF